MTLLLFDGIDEPAVSEALGTLLKIKMRLSDQNGAKPDEPPVRRDEVVRVGRI